MEISRKLKQKLAKEEKSIKWFVLKYLPTITYSSFSSQINGFNKITEKVQEAIEKYLGE